MMAFRHMCATPWLSLMARRCSSGETHWRQQGTPAVTLPHRRDGLNVLLRAVWCPFRRPSMCRPVHCEFMRNAWLDLTTIVPATPCHQRNYVEPYSRYMDGVMVTPHENAAVKNARFVLQAVDNNKLRHETLQDFMLVNDSVTVAVEVPIVLEAQDCAAFRELGWHVPFTLARGEVITGHIDIVQIRYGLIHILDYKPAAKKIKPIEQLTIYALALSRLTGISLYHFKCAWFDDTHYFDFFPRTVVQKRGGRGR